MSFSRRALLGLLVLGVFGMHGLMVSCGTATAHHALSTAAAVMHAQEPSGQHDATAPAPAPGPAPADHNEGEAVLVLCIALLMVLAVVAVGGRRTTWVSVLERARSRTPLPLPPVLRDATPVPRFTVMRC